MIRTLLDEKIEENLKLLSKCRVGSQEANAVLDELSKLEGFRIEELKLENDKEDKENHRKDQLFDRWITFGLQVGATVLPLLAYDIWYRRGLRFEETGTIGSPMVRNLMSKLIPNKKG